MAASNKHVCNKCGKILEDDFLVCPYCGTPVAQQASSKSQRNKNKLGSGKTGQFFSSLVTLVVNLAAVIWTWVKLLPGKIARSVRDLDWVRLKNGLIKISQAITAFFKRLFSAIRSWDWQGFKQKASDLFRKLWAVLSAAAAWIGQTAARGWDWLKKIFRRAQDFITQKLLKKMAPAKAKRLSGAIILIILVTLCACPLMLIAGSGSEDGEKETADIANSDAPEDEAPILEQTADEEPTPVVDPAQQTWLVMFYIDADDDVLEEDLHFDLNEIETVGSTDRVKLVAQIDRYPENFKGDGNWTGARRYEVTQDPDLNTITTEVEKYMGEVDMGDAASLVDFATWAIQSYPADRHVLIMSDHGSSWIGGWFDDDPDQGSMIKLDQLDAALAQIREKTGIGQFELVGLDACNMGMLEVYSMLADHARYAVASEEYEPGIGWAYNHFLSRLTEKPEMSGAQLANAIVNGYVDRDLRITDDDARQAMLAAVGVETKYTAEVIAEKFREDITLSAVDLAVIPELHAAFNELLQVVQDVDQSLLAEARSYAQPFLNVFYDDYPSPLIDMGSFLDLLAEKGADSPIPEKVARLKSIMEKAIIKERHGPKMPGASGISLYFPVSEHYFSQGLYSQENYPILAASFAQDSLWDDFLAFHYAGKAYGEGPPDISERAQAPGYEQISVSIPQLSADTISVDDTRITVQAQVEGDRIAYMYSVIMLRYQDRYLIYNREYVQGDSNEKTGGVVFPEWKRKNGIIQLKYKQLIAPTVISDGTTSAFAVVEPRSYGEEPEDRIYSVKGRYIYTDTGAQVDARMNFYADQGGEMRDIIGFIGSVETGIRSYPIKPRMGDQFMFLDTWWEQDQDGNWVDVLRDGNTLTFGGQPFVQGIYPDQTQAGDYRVGIMVEDMDGNEWAAFAPLTIE